MPQSGAATPVPSITRTGTNSSNRLSLSKTLTWGRSSRLTPEEKERKKLEEWRRKDAEAWNMAPKKPNKHKSKAHQDLLRTFELRFKDVRASLEGRRPSSMFSGISPGQSRVNSVDNGYPAGRKRSSAAGLGPLSREVSLEDDAPPHSVGTVLEE
jgi:hypothetical protein